MSESEIESQISAKEDEITKIAEEANKKEASAEKEIEAEWDAQIAEAETKLTSEQKLLDEATEKASEWAATKKEKGAAVKGLVKEVKTLKSGKTKALNTKLKEIDKDKKMSVKAVQSEIKSLQKELKALQKAAAAAAAGE